MRLGILSDTHDRLDRTARAAELLRGEGAEVLFHCGDLTGPAVVALCGILPCHFVFGNNDADDVPALRRAIDEVKGVCLEWAGEVTLAGKRVAMTHGHLTRDVRRLLLGRPDYLLSGHSHVPADRRDGPTRCLNPGALHRARRFTVALLDLESDSVRFLEVAR